MFDSIADSLPMSILRHISLFWILKFEYQWPTHNSQCREPRTVYFSEPRKTFTPMRRETQVFLPISMFYDAVRDAIVFSPSLSEVVPSFLAHQLLQRMTIRVCSALQIWVELIPRHTAIDKLTGGYRGFLRTSLMAFAAVFAGPRSDYLSERHSRQRGMK